MDKAQPRLHLTEARNAHGWSQQEVAEQIGSTYVNVSRWERGITRPSPYFRKKLCALFGKTEQELDLALGPEAASEQEPDTDAMPTVRPTAPLTREPFTPIIPFIVPGALYDPSTPLPPAIHLVGRDEALATLRQRLLSGGGSVALTALNGLPGVGKTALSITLAHDPTLRAHFTDGVLWAGLGPRPNMQGHLSRWGALLGISSNEMGSLNGMEAWAMALRRIIGSRTMLLVIDDAWSLEDALVLKVGGPHCAHLVSTRFPYIATQVAAEGATAIRELSTEEGMQLLRMLAPQVVEAEEQRARELVMAVGGLPLALNLMGNYLRMQAYTGQSRRISMALQRLSDASERLNISEPRGPAERHPSLPGDVPVSLRSVIAVTDQQLDERNREALHSLAVFPPRPNSFSEEAALAVADCSVEIIDLLTDTGLLESSGHDRYSLHSTIADYARLQLRDYNAQLRLSAYITEFAEAHRKEYEHLEIESTNILTALEVAVEQARYGELIRIACAFAPFLLARGLYPQAETHLQRAYNAAVAQSDSYGLANTLLYLGELAQKQGNYSQAEQYLLDGLGYAREVGDSDHICAILMNLGTVGWKTGRHAQSEEYLQEGLTLAREHGNVERISGLLTSLGSVSTNQAKYAQAEVYLQEGLVLARQIADREQICTILIILGAIASEQGNYEQAEQYYREGLVLARQINHRERIAGLLSNLGDAAGEQGNHKEAEQYFLEGLELAKQIENREWMSLLLLNLGLSTRKQGNYTLAKEYLQESLLLAKQINIPQITCHILYEYGNLYLDQQQPETAQSHFQEMLALVPKGSQDLLAFAQYGLARALTIQKKTEEALLFGEASVAILETIGHRNAKEVKRWLTTHSK